jgi:hypothetical protein
LTINPSNGNLISAFQPNFGGSFTNAKAILDTEVYAGSTTTFNFFRTQTAGLVLPDQPTNSLAYAGSNAISSIADGFIYFNYSFFFNSISQTWTPVTVNKVVLPSRTVKKVLYKNNLTYVLAEGTVGIGDVRTYIYVFNGSSLTLARELYVTPEFDCSPIDMDVDDKYMYLLCEGNSRAYVIKLPVSGYIPLRGFINIDVDGTLLTFRYGGTTITPTVTSSVITPQVISGGTIPTPPEYSVNLVSANESAEHV